MNGPLSCRPQNKGCQKTAVAMKTMQAQTVTREGKHKLLDGIMTGSAAHRKWGLWAIDSVNGNSWIGGPTYPEFTSADVVCYQETKFKEDDAMRSAEDIAGGLAWKLSMSRAVSGERGGASAGMGITIRKHLGLAHPDYQ